MGYFKICFFFSNIVRIFLVTILLISNLIMLRPENSPKIYVFGISQDMLCGQHKINFGKCVLGTCNNIYSALGGHTVLNMSIMSNLVIVLFKSSLLIFLEGWDLLTVSIPETIYLLGVLSIFVLYIF